MLVYYQLTTTVHLYLYLHYHLMAYHISNNAFYRIHGTVSSYNYRNLLSLSYTLSS